MSDPVNAAANDLAHRLTAHVDEAAPLDFQAGRVSAVLDLGYPFPPLTLNHRHSRFERARRIAEIKTRTHWLAKAAKLPKGLPHVEVTLHYTTVVNRTRDDDNLVDTLKPVCDALKAGTKRDPGYGMVLDDDPKHMRKNMPVIDGQDPAAASGRVWVELIWEQQP